MDDTRLAWRECARLTAGQDMWSTYPVPSINLSSVRFADGPMGVTGGRVDERDVALLTPCGLAMAASWDRGLVAKVGQVIGEEANRTGVQGMLAPNLNLMRSPLAGRAFELFGEDPLLITELGNAWAAGVQSKGVAAVIKHLVCNDSETQRKLMNVQVDEQTLREVYFRPFEQAAITGAWGMLTAYNRVNGVQCAENVQAIGWLKNELGWDGLVMSDWFGTQDGAASLNAGLDLEMPGPARHMGEQLLGHVDGARLEDAVSRIERLANRTSKPATFDDSQGAHARRLLTLEEAASAGMVLLRNSNGLLPLQLERGQRLAVIGPNATEPCFQGGTFAKVALSPDVVMPMHAIEERFSRLGVEVEYAQGVAAEHRIPPLGCLGLEGPDRQPGLSVSFISSDGNELHEEVRYASSLIWFKQMPGVGDLLRLEGQATVRVRTRFLVERSGTHRFYFGGTGKVSLTVDEKPVGHFDGLALGEDIMGKLMQSPHDTVPIDLTKGEWVDLEYRMEIGRSLAHGLWFGCLPPEIPNLLQQAVELASRSDAVVLVVGETADAGLESVDRDTTYLSVKQQALIRAVCAANPRTTVVLNVAHPVDTRCLDDAAAVLVAWYPGQGFGDALSSVLVGDREPGGRLPITFAKEESDYPIWSLQPDVNLDLQYSEGWWVGYRHFLANDIEPAFAFGHGLGFATVEPGLPKWAGDHVDDLRLEILLANRSERSAKAVPQLYIEAQLCAGGLKRVSLEGFDSLLIEKGSQAQAVINVSRKSFSRWDPAHQRWKLVPGVYSLFIGESSVESWYCAKLTIAATGAVLVSDWEVAQKVRR